MAFTFDLDSADAQTRNISQIRLLIGDTVEDSGPLPNEANFQDNEILTFFSLENSHIERAAAKATETLARAWAKHAGLYELGPESEEFKQSEAYSKEAKAMRQIYGWYRDSTAAASHGGVSLSVRPPA